MWPLPARRGGSPFARGGFNSSPSVPAGKCGYRRLTALLRREGYLANKKRVFRLMQEDNLSSLRRAKYVLAILGTNCYPCLRNGHTSQAVQRRVVALHMAGQSQRRIASEEGIDRETVSRILWQQEVTEMIAQYLSRLLTFIPKAIVVYEEALESDDLRVAFAAATKLLEGMRVIGNGFVEGAGNGVVTKDGTVYLAHSPLGQLAGPHRGVAQQEINRTAASKTRRLSAGSQHKLQR